MSVGIKIPLSGLVRFEDPLERSNGLSIAGAATSAIVRGSALDAIAVNVHVGQLAISALDVHDVVVAQVVTTVAESCSSD